VISPRPTPGAHRSATVEAILFDFNGTLSDDEHVIAEVYSAVFADHGRPMPPSTYLEQFAGKSDRHIVETWLGLDGADACAAVIEDRVRRYVRETESGHTIAAGVREAVGHAALHVATGIVSAAARVEIEAVLRGAGILGLFDLIVAEDDVQTSKPSPEGYLRAVTALVEAGCVTSTDGVLAVEDSPTGVTAARRAGLRCVAVRGTAPDSRLHHADEIIPRLDKDAIATLVGA
jgi:beta-phosphoglucomutase-like phosphatase (HAD superfamily)